MGFRPDLRQAHSVKFIALWIAAAILCGPSWAGDKEMAELKTTARQLDRLVSQTNVVFKETTKPGFEPVKARVPPIPLERIARSAAPHLKLSESEIARLLAGDQTKLSELALARVIEEAGGEPWRNLLKEKNAERLYRLIEERMLLEKVTSILDELYIEMSFAALDQLEGESAIGIPPASGDGGTQPDPEE